jgi:formate dehydrogenase iron-sulfur subunit
MKRRSFLAALAAAGTAAVATRSEASTGATDTSDSYGMLIDLTKCGGCQTCEFVCAEANGLPEPESVDIEGSLERRPSPDQYVAVSSYETSKGEVYVRRQCMHCLEPACAAACLTKAMEKTEEGPVIWTEDRCMGCRYCMISCPFETPQFEFDSPNPKISKCKMCFERLAEGQKPVCVEECPGEALTFGRRSELLEIARKRIYTNPGEYVSHIYGEHEAGGTGVLYLSPVPFEELGFRTDLGETAYPEYTRDFLTAVPVVLFLWPAFLLGLRRSREEKEDPAEIGGAS